MKNPYDVIVKQIITEKTTKLAEENKYTFEDLEPISSADISKKFHKYASILRMFTVSNRENAFK